MRSPWDADFWKIIAGLEDPEAPVDPRRARLREIIRGAGPGGIRLRMAWELLDAESLTVNRDVLHRWFHADAAAGLVRREPRPTGDVWRWAGP